MKLITKYLKMPAFVAATIAATLFAMSETEAKAAVVYNQSGSENVSGTAYITDAEGGYNFAYTSYAFYGYYDDEFGGYYSYTVSNGSVSYTVAYARGVPTGWDWMQFGVI